MLILPSGDLCCILLHTLKFIHILETSRVS